MSDAGGSRQPTKLTAERERTLARAALAGDEHARASLIESTRPWIRKLAQKHANVRVDVEDLEQVGLVEILRVLTRFEQARASAFPHSPIKPWKARSGVPLAPITCRACQPPTPNSWHASPR